MNPPAATIAGIRKRFGERIALDVGELRLEAGGLHAVVGHNGAGKTTLLRTLVGLERPDAGRVSVLGIDVTGARSAELLSLRRRVAFVMQRPYLFASTAGENVEYPLRVRGVERAEGRRRAEAAMDELGVRHLYDRPARSTSAGEAQRVAIARAVVTDPEFALFDEPNANVDPEVRPVVEALLRGLSDRGVTVVVATHDIEGAYRLSADVVRLEAGHVAPPAIDNVIEGELVADGDAVALVVAGGGRINVATDRRGSVRAAVAARDIVVSTERFASSARNVLAGRITRLEERGGLVYVTADVGVPLVSSITPASCGEMKLTIGSDVVYTFKASAVTIF
jgi:tungstate transport system ATP-binding protein